MGARQARTAPDRTRQYQIDRGRRRQAQVGTYRSRQAHRVLRPRQAQISLDTIRQSKYKLSQNVQHFIQQALQEGGLEFHSHITPRCKHENPLTGSWITHVHSFQAPHRRAQYSQSAVNIIAPGIYVCILPKIGFWGIFFPVKAAAQGSLCPGLLPGGCKMWPGGFFLSCFYVFFLNAI